MSAPPKDHERVLPRKRGRSVPAIYGGLSLVLIAFALTFALSSPPPTTPPLAEVAPAPQDQIDVERVEQSSRFGEGAGAGECAPGDPGCEGAAEEAVAPDGRTQQQPEVIETSAPGSFRECFNGGRTQTADPQSPPCLAEIFRGENGGATSAGVTGTEIRVAYPRYSAEDAEARRHALDRFVAHVNDHYERYGRSITLVEVDMPGDTDDPAVQRAHAHAVADADVFAMLSYDGFGAFQRTVAEAGVVTVTDAWDTGPLFEAEVAALHPYAWTVFSGFEDALDATGELVCSSLAGRPARYGGDEVADQTRHFGLFVESRDGGPALDPGTLLRRLEACGVQPFVQTVPDEDADLQGRFQKFRSEGVTTVVCLCRTLSTDYTVNAETIGYRPEWLLAGTSDQRLYIRERPSSTRATHPREQVAHAFGLTANLRQVQRGTTGGTDRSGDFWWHAARDADPGYECFQCAISSMGNYGLYAQLLVLASGIQWAGPELTPQTFADALTSLDHPNPGVGQAPWYQPAVGFGPGDHGLNSDYALFWWRDPDDAAYESRTDIGEMCYVGDGARFTADTLPPGADDLLFDIEEGCR